MSERGYSIFARVAGFLILLVAACMLAVQIPAVQNRLAGIAAQKLDEMFDGRLSWDELHILAPNAVLLKGATMLDDDPYTADEFDRGFPPADTLFHVGTISATMRLKGLLSGEGLHLGRVMVENGVFNLVTEPGDEYVSNINRIFRIHPKGTKPKAGPDIFDIRKAHIRNFRYTMRNFKQEKVEHRTGINYDDLDVTVHEARGRNLRFTGGRMYATVDHLRASEKSGLEISELRGRCAAGQGKVDVDDLYLKDNWSELKLGNYGMHFAWAKSFSHYVDSVRMTASIAPGTLNSRSITAFSGGALDGLDLTLSLDGGHFDGYVNDFSIEDLRFCETGSGVKGSLSGRCTGIPRIGDMLLDAKVSNLQFSTGQLDKLLGSITGKNPGLSKYAPGQAINASARLKGSLNDLDVNMNASTSSAGSLSAEGNVRNILDGKRPIEIDADVNTDRLDAGAILQNGSLGPISLNTSASVVLPGGGGKPQIDIKGVDVSGISMIGHDFRGIRLNGAFNPDGINGVLTSADPAADLWIKLDGSGSPETGNACYRLDGEIKALDLKALGADTKGLAEFVSARIGGHMDSTPGGGLTAMVDISDVRLTGGNGTADLDNISITLDSEGDRATVSLFSELIDASYLGGNDFGMLIDDIQAVTTRRNLSAIYKPGKQEAPEFSGRAYELSAVLHEPYKALQYILPSLYLNDSTKVNLNLDHEGKLQGRITSSRLAWNGNYLKDAAIDLDNYDCLNATITSSGLKAGAFMISDPALTAYAIDNGFSLQLHYDNVAGVGGSGELYLNGSLERDRKGELILTASPLDSYIDVEHQTWDFGESEIVIKGKDISIKEFVVSCGDQRLYIDGGISPDRKDMLDVYMDDFDLSLIDEFLENKIGIQGLATGEAHVQSPTATDIGMMLKFDCEKAALGGSRLGDIALAGRWDEQDNSIRVFINNQLKDRNPLLASVSYDVRNKGIDADITLDRFSPAPATTFIPTVLKDMGGSISGHVKISGSADKPEISSEGTRLDSLTVNLVPTGVTYMLNGAFDADSKGVHFPGLDVSDMAGGRGKLSGSITFDHLRNLGLDLRLVINHMLAVDNPASAGQPFYGRLSASGDASIRGSLRSLLVDASVRTAGSGDIHVPIKSSLIGSTSDLLTFLEAETPLDHYEAMMKERQEQKTQSGKANIGIKAAVGISPSVSAFAEIDGGNVVQAFGSGDIELEINPARNLFSLVGDYNISGGQAKVNAAGVIGKEFSIREGGSIKFGGELMDTELDITAVHSLKTSLSNLLADSTAVASRKEVECGLRLSDKLRKPAISFSIDFPDLDPTTRAQVESMLNTEDKVQKQFVALLLFGSFLPDELSGIVNGSGSTLLTNVSSIMSGQINTILQKLNIPVDLGLGYQQNSGGDDIFDVAVSTQLFNDRVIVNGSFGNRQYKSTGTTDMVGDVDVDIKVGRQGNFRVNLFSHSADDYTSYLDYSQRSGAGLSYQKEFNKLSELFRQLFRKKRGESPEQQPDRNEAGTVTINIEK